MKPKGRARFILRTSRLKFLWLACVFGGYLPLLYGEADDRAASRETHLKLRHIKNLVESIPENSTTQIVDYVRAVVDAKPNDRSLAARMSDLDLWKVLEETGRFIPSGFKFQGSVELVASLDALEKEFVSQKVALPTIKKATYPKAVSAVLKMPALISLFDRIRNPSDPERHWAFIGLARNLSRIQRETIVVELDQSGRRKVTPIMQKPNHCVSACGLMALQRMTGMDLPADLQSHLAELDSRAAAKGREGASFKAIYPKVGLDCLEVNYAEELQSRRAEERMRFAISVLNDRIVPELKVGKLVVLVIESSPVNHAILLCGVSKDGNIEQIDPNGGARDVSADYLASRWYIRERESLKAAIISFPTLPDPPPETPPARLSLEIPPDAQSALLAKFAIDSEDLTVEKLNTEAKSFRWIDMTLWNKDGADPAELRGIPLGIQLQLLAGRPVGSIDRKGNRLLFTGYSGPLGGAETSFKVETTEGQKDLTWVEVAKLLTVESSKGKKTLFLGYLLSEVGPYRLSL